MIAFLSDIHGHWKALEAVLEDADRLGVRRFVCLGDVGSSLCLDLLAKVQATCVFGNWEVSGWHRYATRHLAWVRAWPPVWREDQWAAAHASPDWPYDIETVEEASAYRQEHRMHWLALFPALDRDWEARWRALAALEAMGAWVGFHGHTHVQEVWHWQPEGRMVRVQADQFDLAKDGSRYIVGVGSVGDPRDGQGACYAVWDPKGRVCLRRVPV